MANVTTLIFQRNGSSFGPGSGPGVNAELFTLLGFLFRDPHLRCDFYTNMSGLRSHDGLTWIISREQPGPPVAYHELDEPHWIESLPLLLTGARCLGRVQIVGGVPYPQPIASSIITLDYPQGHQLVQRAIDCYNRGPVYGKHSYTGTQLAIVDAFIALRSAAVTLGASCASKLT